MDTEKVVRKVLGRNIICRTCGYSFKQQRDTIRNMCKCPHCGQRSEFA